MGLSIHLEKREENSTYCVYVFGSPKRSVGRLVLNKDSGDIELADFSSTSESPSEQFYLAHAVSRLQAYHDQNAYPTYDRWET